MSVLDAIADDRRKAMQSIKQRAQELVIDWLNKLFNKNFTQRQFDHKVDRIFDAITIPDGWSLIDKQETYQTAINQYMSMMPPNSKAYEVLYHNPTYFTINVEPCGIINEEGEKIKTVNPGGFIRVPLALTIGKFSTMQSNAPQLQQAKVEKDEILLSDITPASHDEWCFFLPYRRSSCCKREVIWSNTMQAIVCSKCLIEQTNV